MSYWHTLGLFFCLLFSSLSSALEDPTTAFYYAANPPLDLLATYERVVVEPDNITAQQLQVLQQRGVSVYAYLSIGEVGGTRPWFDQIKPRWKLGTNGAWKSAVMDMSSKEWHDYLLNNRIQTLWQRGYRAFFLDTMDSYFLYAKSKDNIHAQQHGMVSLLTAIKQQYSGVQLLFNRGFEILPQASHLASGVVAESLFVGWNPTKSTYQNVKASDREWLVGKLNTVRDQYHLPVTVIDYLPPERRNQAEQVAEQIKALGFTPWVSTPALDYMGVGSRKLIPRKVLFLYDSSEKLLQHTEIHRFLAMPLEYLGYIPDYWDVNQGQLPDFLLKGRYAGIVSWLSSRQTHRDQLLATWLLQQLKQQLPVAFMAHYPFADHPELTHYLGLTIQQKAIDSTARLHILSEHMNYELNAVKRSLNTPLIQTKTDQAWLHINNHKGQVFSPVFIDSWGGMALFPYLTQTIPALNPEDEEYERWIINPFEFLKAALQLQAIPVPDSTTENGYRILTLHIDGDGFYNRTQVKKGRYSPELILDEFIKPHGLPHTVSIIEGEISQAGLQPNLSSTMEAIAQKIFALDNVEIASHSFSHPFDWFKAAAQSINRSDYIQGMDNVMLFKAKKGHYHLPIANYIYNAEREIKGSVDYINQTLAPHSKKAKVFLWSGDCLPNEEALAWTEKIQLINMNGGDTIIRQGLNSITNISASGIVRGQYFQAYAPIQNENVYTHDWTGPFYGYQRVIETFQLTEYPKRLKPISIYYHFYSGDRSASVGALHRVYDWARQQDTLALWISEYAPRLKAFRHASIEQIEKGWRIYGAEQLRTLRLPKNFEQIDIARSNGVVGFHSIDQGTYLALDGSATVSFYQTHQANTLPFLKTANARIDYWKKYSQSIEFRLKGHQAVRFTLANMNHSCRLKTLSGKIITGKKQQNKVLFSFKNNDTGVLKVVCG